MLTAGETLRIDFALRQSQKLVAVYIHFWRQWAATRVDILEK